MRKPDTTRADEGQVTVIDPDPRGRIRHSTGAIYSYAPRTLPIHAVIHDSVFERMKNVLPVYAPQSLFNLNEGLVQKRTAIDEEVGRLVDTRSLSKEECEKIRNWSNEKLSLTKWSEYLDLELDDKSLMKDHLKPAGELSND